MAENPVDLPKKSRATLARIADDASVSMSTVSKVLNGRSGVSHDTRNRVEELLHAHGYNRRGADHAPGSLIELVFETIDSEWSLEIIRGVQRIAVQNGLSVILTETGDRHTQGPAWLEGVIQRRPIGIILVFSDLAPDSKRQLRTRNIPFVVIDPAGDPAPDVPSIGSANWSGGLMATRHLIDLGHRRIGMITGHDDHMSSRARASGYRSALEKAGIEVDDRLIRIGNFHHDAGLRLGTQLLELADPPTAIFAGNDLQAFGVYEAARAKGLSIPDDLSVVGYDDIVPAQWVGPALTTVRQPLSEMAEEATRLVLRLRDREGEINVRMDLATSLVVRGSTRAPSA